MPGPCHEDHVQVIFLDQAVQVDVDESQAGARSPVTQQPVFDVLRLERLLEERVALQVNHAQSEIVAGPPVRLGFP